MEYSDECQCHGWFRTVNEHPCAIPGEYNNGCMELSEECQCLSWFRPNDEDLEHPCASTEY